MELGIGIRDLEFGYWIRIGDCELGLEIGYWDWGLGIEIIDWLCLLVVSFGFDFWLCYLL